MIVVMKRMQQNVPAAAIWQRGGGQKLQEAGHYAPPTYDHSCNPGT